MTPFDLRELKELCLNASELTPEQAELSIAYKSFKHAAIVYYSMGNKSDGRICENLMLDCLEKLMPEIPREKWAPLTGLI